MAYWRWTNEVTAQLSQNGENDDFVLLKYESLPLGEGLGFNGDAVNKGASG
jgi:hypothetical protein